jgi:hypothetical protein
MNLGTLKSKMAWANFAGGPKCTFWARGVHTVGSWQHASSRHGLPTPCQVASFRDFGLFLGGRACRGNDKAWAGQAKACDAKATPWLPRHGLPRPRHVLPWLPRLVTAKPWAAKAKACAAKAMPWLPRHATAKACAAKACHSQGMLCQGNAMAAKACHGQGMCCQGNAMGCQGLPRPRHVFPRKCHGLPRHATAKAMPWLPRHATAKACAAKACHG